LECQLFAYDVYQEIFEKKYIKSSKKYTKSTMAMLWSICSKLMESTTKCNDNNIDSFNLLSHSLTTSSVDKICKILKLWQSVNANDNYNHAVHSIAMSLRKRKGEIISDSEDSDDYQQRIAATNSTDWDCFAEDMEQRPPSYKMMDSEQIKKEVGMNEMEQMIDLYFETDPDLLIGQQNDGIYAMLSTTNKHWNRSNLLSNALITCSNVHLDNKEDELITYPNKQNFETLIVNIIENMYLCDSTELITFLLLIDDLDTMTQSFNAVLANKNIPRFKRTQILEIALKYFTYQTIGKLQQYLEYADEETISDDLYALIPSNVSVVFSMEIDAEDPDDEEADESVNIEQIVKCEGLRNINDPSINKAYKKALSCYQKWLKITKK